MIWTKKIKPSIYPEWVRVPGIVVAVYEKSIIYSIPVGHFRKRVRLPLSALEMKPLPDGRNLMVRGWLVHREGLPAIK